MNFFKNKPFIVAEMSANHLGSLDRAIQIVQTAAKVGADAIKLQTFDPEQMVGDRQYELETGPWQGRRLIDLYREAHTPRWWHKYLFEEARGLDIECFSTPFHQDDVAFLESLDCPAYKISSFEITDLELIRTCAATGKPLIISTGMASFDEIVAAKEAAGSADLTFLKCTSAYPAKVEYANLHTMQHMLRYIGAEIKVGISDHTAGIGVAIAASVLGASVIEKHLTLSRDDGGLDAAFSMEPHEFAQMVTECRTASKAGGHTYYGPGDSELSSYELRRSLWFDKPIAKGQTIQPGDVKTARPALGMSPKDLSLVLGKRAARDINPGEPVTPDDIQS